MSDWSDFKGELKSLTQKYSRTCNEPNLKMTAENDLLCSIVVRSFPACSRFLKLGVSLVPGMLFCTKLDNKISAAPLSTLSLWPEVSLTQSRG